MASLDIRPIEGNVLTPEIRQNKIDEQEKERQAVIMQLERELAQLESKRGEIENELLKPEVSGVQARQQITTPEADAGVLQGQSSMPLTGEEQIQDTGNIF